MRYRPRSRSAPPNNQTSKPSELPFCVQGSENGLTIDGGATIGHEVADQLAMLGLPLDRIFVQVGGGIIDDETYDWMALLRATFATGGWPIVASEDALVEANRLACTGPDPAR